MTYDHYLVELTKAKRSLEDLANEAEEGGFKVRLQFNQDMDEKRHKGRPHSISISLAKEIK